MTLRSYLIWIALGFVIAVPIVLAATSPLLQWRQPIYIAAGFSGIIGMGLLLVQPLLASEALPISSTHLSRRIHRVVGAAVVLAIIVHIAGLWMFSPPDVVDALLFRSPTPFSAWGVIAMCAAFAAAFLALTRRRLKLPPMRWRRLHMAVAATTVVGSVIHAMLIEGTMEPISKTVLCLFALAATTKALIDLAIWRRR